tara:strand:+ start:3738 stop:4721 length:984 start_codon:yes stop_codon:yes gene_type:complete
MAAQNKSESADSLWSSVRKTIRPGVEDSFFEDYPTVAALRSDMLKTDGGSSEIQVNIQTNGGSAQSFDTYDVLGKSPIDPIEAAFFNRRYYAVPVILSDTENWENMGKERVFDLFKALGDNAMDSLVKAINEDVYTAQAGKNMLGFPNIMATSAGATIGGIDSSATTAWESQRNTTAKTFLTQTTANVFDGFTEWDKLLDSIRIQGGKPSHMFTTFSIARSYRTALSSAGYARTELSNAKGPGGSLAPDWYGVKVIPDNDCPALHTYVADKRHLHLNTLKQASFKKTPFVSLQSNGQLAQLAYVVASVQLSTNNRRRLGVATAITGS